MATSTEGRRSAAAISAAFAAACNAGELDRIDGIVTGNFVCHHTASGGEIEGGAAYKRRVARLREAFPDFEVRGELPVVDGDHAAGHYRWAGTHEGGFRGVPAPRRSAPPRGPPRWKAQRAV